MSRFLYLVLFSVLAASVPAQVVVDPAGGGNFKDLQTAFDRSPAGSVFRVKGGTYRALKITKTATIIGDPAPTLISEDWVSGKPANQPPVIRLTGTGKEELTLVNVKIGGQSKWGWSLQGAGIDGVDFAHVRIHRSTVRAMEWPNQVTGVALSTAGIRLRNTKASVRVTVTDSKVFANAARDDTDDQRQNILSGEAAIDAPGATVVVVGGEVRGGNGSNRYFRITLPPKSCPCPRFGSLGGPGVRAHTVLSTPGAVRSGRGGEFFYRGRSLGRQSSFPPILATRTWAIRDDGVTGAQPAVGKVWSVQFPTSQLVAVGLSLPAPVRVGRDWLFVDLQWATYVPSSKRPVQVRVPNISTLAGLPVAAQAYDLFFNRLGTPLVEVVAF